ncbi:MAG: ATP-binding protein [Rhodothermales bacterium]
MARSIHTLAIPSSTRYLEDVRRFVVMHAQEADFPEDAVEHFKIAVDEACTNVIEHAYGGQSDREVDIAIIIDADKFTIRIRDKGLPFDQSTYQEPDLLELTRHRKGGGLGVHIIRRLMDRVEYRKRGRVNEIRLTKYRNSQRSPNGKNS